MAKQKQKTHLSFLDIIKDARDSRLFRKAEQSLYYHLALYVDSKKDYSCFPSYAALCEDTGLDAKTLQKAAASLQEKGLIHLHLRHNRSNLWFLNVAKVQETAELSREQRDDAPLTSPFAPPVLPVEESDKAPDTEFPAQRSADERERMEKIRKLLLEELGEHPTYTLDNSKAIMDSCVEAMIEIAGSAKKCLTVLKVTFQDDSKKSSVLNSNQLGGYLKKCFPGWLSEWDDSILSELDTELCDLCSGVGVSDVYPKSIFQDHFPAFVREKLGEHLIDLREMENDGKIRYEADVTPQARIAGIISSTAEIFFIDPKGIPVWMNEEIVEELERMVADDGFVSAMKESECALDYCIERLRGTVPIPDPYDLD